MTHTNHLVNKFEADAVGLVRKLNQKGIEKIERRCLLYVRATMPLETVVMELIEKTNSALSNPQRASQFPISISKKYTMGKAKLISITYHDWDWVQK